MQIAQDASFLIRNQLQNEVSSLIALVGTRRTTIRRKKPVAAAQLRVKVDNFSGHRGGEAGLFSRGRAGSRFHYTAEEFCTHDWQDCLFMSRTEEHWSAA